VWENRAVVPWGLPQADFSVESALLLVDEDEEISSSQNHNHITEESEMNDVERFKVCHTKPESCDDMVDLSSLCNLLPILLRR
jgi:hypothetical protein